MRAVDLIRDKREGRSLSSEEIHKFIAEYTAGAIPDYQMAAMAMAIFFKGLSDRELADWTDAMLHSGEVLDLHMPPGAQLIDKHSTGGVGDTTSLILAPLAAACGLKVPMISGRGLGHTGGTLDKLESIAGFDVCLSVERLEEIVKTHGFVITGQTAEIAPADRKLYALRDVTATVRCIPLIASSIMSKKLAEGIDGLVLDVKTGDGAFMTDREEARLLAQTMVAIGQRMGVRTSALITDMDQPLGQAIGNALEVREAIDVLKGQGAADMVTLTCHLAAEMLLLAGHTSDPQEAHEVAQATLESGEPLARFRAVVEAQGGDPRCVDDPTRLPSAKHQEPWEAPRSGYITELQCTRLGRIAMHLGAGRAKASDSVDHGVGLWLHRKCGERVSKGEPLVTIYANSEAELEQAKRELAQAVAINSEPPTLQPLILERIE